MDFILDSDSDTAYSPHIKSRVPVKSAVGRTIASSFQKSLKSGDEPRIITARQSGSSKAELREAYERLETPKITRTTGRVTGFEESRERMRLANIIDSETNGDDTDNFLMPITMQSLDEYEKNSRMQQQKYKHPPLAALDLELSGVSDAEDILTEFTENRILRAQLTSEVTPRSDTRVTKNDEADFGQLLQVDSNSEQGTPKYRAMRDELDQSRTRFRQSINDLLNSSPPRTRAEFKDLVKGGSKLGEQVYRDIESIEGQTSTRRVNPIQSSSPIQPKKMSTEELLALANNPQSSLFELDQKQKSQSANVTDTDVDADEDVSNMSIFVRRVGWALFVISSIFFVDLIIQVVVMRQQSGLPVVDFDGFEMALQSLKDWALSMVDLTVAPH